MENKEGISIVELLKMAVKHLWIIILAVIFCVSAAVVYTTFVVVPEYTSNSTFCIQTKGQNAESDVLESQRTVAYAQLVVGTYIDILDTRDFAQEVAFYMNGNVSEKDLSFGSGSLEAVVKSDKATTYFGESTDKEMYIKKIDEFTAPLEKNEKVTYSIHGKTSVETLKDMISNPVSYGLKYVISEDGDEISSYSVYAFADYKERKDLKVAEVSDGTSSSRLSTIISDLDKSGLDEVNVYVDGFCESEKLDELLNCFITKELLLKSAGENPKITALKNIDLAGEEEVDDEYTASDIESKLSFKFEEESISFNVATKSTDPKEAYRIARCVEIVTSDYIEQKFPGVGVVTVIEAARESTNPTNNNTLIFILAGILAGAVIGLVISYIIESTDNTVRSEKDITSKLDLPIIGVIPDVQYEQLQSNNSKNKGFSDLNSSKGSGQNV